MERKSYTIEKLQLTRPTETNTHIRNAHDENDDDRLHNKIVHMSKSTQNVCSSHRPFAIPIRLA